MRLTSTATWRDPRVIGWFLGCFSTGLVWFAVLGDASALGDVVFAAVVAIGTTVGFAAALAAWPSDVEAPGVLVPIFAVYSVLMIGIWVLIRR